MDSSNLPKIIPFSNLLLNIHDDEFDDYEIESPPSPIKNITTDVIFREYIKEGEYFKALDNFYDILNNEEEYDYNYICNHSGIKSENLTEDSFILCPSKKSENKIYYNKEKKSYYILHRKFEETTGLFYNEKEYIDLYIIKDISLDENTLQISKQELILKMSLQNIEFDEKFIKDLYLDTYYYLTQDEHFVQQSIKMKKKYIFATFSHQLPNPQQISIF